MSSPLEYCQTQVASPGNALYYQSLFLNTDHQHRLFALHCLYQHLTQISRRHSEAELAQKKLSWWQQELRAAELGNATHPCTQALITTQCQFDGLDKVLNTVANELQFAQFEDTASMEQFADHRYSWLINQLVINEISSSQREALTFSLYCNEILRYFYQDFQLSICYLPIDYCRTYPVLLSKKLNHDVIQQFTHSLQELLSKKTDVLQQRPLSSIDSPYGAYLNALTQMTHLECEKVARRPQVLLSQAPILLPISMLWLMIKIRWQDKKP